MRTDGGRSAPGALSRCLADCVQPKPKKKAAFAKAVPTPLGHVGTANRPPIREFVRTATFAPVFAEDGTVLTPELMPKREGAAGPSSLIASLSKCLVSLSECVPSHAQSPSKASLAEPISWREQHDEAAIEDSMLARPSTVNLVAPEALLANRQSSALAALEQRSRPHIGRLAASIA